MMKFLNRHKEIERLNGLLQLDDGGVAVIWGRRRVGKTRLLLEWISGLRGIYYTADESSAAVQRKYFAAALEQALPGFASVEYPDWNVFFARLGREARQVGWKGPLIIDELPYLIAQSPELPSILQRFIDIDAKRARMVIALCGSSQRMMQGAILDASAPLYGRAHEIIKLGPISVGYIGEGLGLSTARDCVEAYSIWGGIPRYWELIKNHNGSLIDTIDRLVLDPTGPLNDEPNRLLLEEIPPAVALRPILDAIGLGANRLSEISARVGSPATSLARPMHRLIELDLVQREIPYGQPEHSSKRTLYKIKDPFVRFWFELVASNRSHMAQSHPSARKKWLQERLQGLFAKTWEELCRASVPSLSDKRGSIHFGSAGRYWHGQGSEWDIIAETLGDSTLLIGEAKWPLKTPTNTSIQKALGDMKAKGYPPLNKRHRSYVYCLFVPEKPKGLIVPDDCRVIDAAEIVQALQ